MKVLITQWFNVYNREHIKAYKHLQETGMWPIDFIPENVVITSKWQIILMMKMVDAWVYSMLKNKTD